VLLTLSRRRWGSGSEPLRLCWSWQCFPDFFRIFIPHPTLDPTDSPRLQPGGAAACFFQRRRHWRILVGHRPPGNLGLCLRFSGGRHLHQPDVHLPPVSLSRPGSGWSNFLLHGHGRYGFWDCGMHGRPFDREFQKTGGAKYGQIHPGRHTGRRVAGRFLPDSSPCGGGQRWDPPWNQRPDRTKSNESTLHTPSQDPVESDGFSRGAPRAPCSCHQ